MKKLSKEDKAQVALGTKFECAMCNLIYLIKFKAGWPFRGQPACIRCAYEDPVERDVSV